MIEPSARIDPKRFAYAMVCTEATAQKWAPHFEAAMMEYGIMSLSRAAMFIAQVGHETGSLQFTTEIWGPTAQQRRYERNFAQPWPGVADDPRDSRFDVNRLAYTLGNVLEGDGAKFRGHGGIQVTGRTNHAGARDRLRKRLGPHVPDFEISPHLLSLPDWAIYSAGDYWNSRSINVPADAQDVVRVTRLINGGENGIADRRIRLKRAMEALS